jgi:hypothetical protein
VSFQLRPSNPSYSKYAKEKEKEKTLQFHHNPMSTCSHRVVQGKFESESKAEQEKKAAGSYHQLVLKVPSAKGLLTLSI